MWSPEGMHLIASSGAVKPPAPLSSCLTPTENDQNVFTATGWDYNSRRGPPCAYLTLFNTRKKSFRKNCISGHVVPALGPATVVLIGP